MKCGHIRETMFWQFIDKSHEVYLRESSGSGWLTTTLQTHSTSFYTQLNCLWDYSFCHVLKYKFFKNQIFLLSYFWVYFVGLCSGIVCHSHTNWYVVIGKLTRSMLTPALFGHPVLIYSLPPKWTVNCKEKRRVLTSLFMVRAELVLYGFHRNITLVSQT